MSPIKKIFTFSILYECISFPQKLFNTKKKTVENFIKIKLQKYK